MKRGALIYGLWLMPLLTACGPDLRSAQLALRDEDYKTAVPVIEELSEFGIPEAQRELGVLYLKGKGVESNAAKGLALVNEAVAADDPKAYFELAQAYESGRGVEADGARAAELYETAGNKGYIRGFYYAGRLYHRGKLTDYDPEKAIVLYSRALEAGYFRAAYTLGLIYEKEEDRENAAEYYRIAAAHGILKASEKLRELDS